MCSVLFFLLLAAWPTAGVAQQPVTSVRVSVSPSHLGFTVDGQYFTGAATFQWPVGSKHVLSAPSSVPGLTLGTQYGFNGWRVNSDSELQQGQPLIIAADPAIAQYTAEYSTQYRIRLSFSGIAGSVYAGGTRYTSTVDLWVNAGKALDLEAVPNPGWVCAGWRAPYIESGFTATLVATRPLTVSPNFVPVQRVRLETSPPGLRMMADRTLTPTPTVLEWGYDTAHILSPVSPQYDLQGRRWVFSKWSDGAPATRTYKVPVGDREERLVAEFVLGAPMTFATNPPGLKLVVDGRDDWYGGYNFSWGVGEIHTVEAPLEQNDKNGRKWVFRGWSNGGTAAQEVTVTEDHLHDGTRLTAEYALMGRLTLQASVPGLTATVDGEPCAMPCTLDRMAGTTVEISVPGSLEAGDGARFGFEGWSDAAGDALRTMAFDTEARVLTANYGVMYQLAVTADPPEGAAFLCEPPSPDGFYRSGTRVVVRAEERPGFRFRRLEGDLNGDVASGVVEMSGPRFVRAIYDPVPYIAPSGVRNAAGETPLEAVAANSAISIYGASLASAVEIGPDNPLAQSLAGVTVRVNDRVLPLLFVSPEQINAQLPYDLEPGEYTLAVWQENRAEVKSTFTVARNAPGLFQNIVDEVPWAVALHPDGSPVTAEAPARRGEVVTVYGTGFGPTVPPAVHGFAVPDTPAFTLADPVELVAGERVLEPQWIGLEPGRVAVNAFRFVVAQELPSGAVPLLLRVNGVASNSVQLAVE